MPKYKIHVSIDAPVYTGYIVLDIPEKAVNMALEEYDALEDRINDLYQNSPEQFVWDPEDMSKVDFVEIDGFEKIKE